MKKQLCVFLSLLIILSCVSLAPTALAEDPAGHCPDLASCKGLVWHIDDSGTILCEDIENRRGTCTLPLSELHEADEHLTCVSIASWTEGSVMLTLGLRDAAGAPTLRLLELAPTAEAIDVIKTLDATEQLGFLIDGDTPWYEVNTVGCQERLYIAALDADYRFHLYGYAPGSQAPLSLGECPLDSYIAALPYGDDMLIAGPNPMDDGLLELTCLCLDDGSTRPLDAVRVDSAVRASNFAWDESQQRLYYTVNNTVYALSPGSAEAPKPVGTLSAMPAQLRVGAVVGSRYIALAERGALLSCDVQAAAAPSVVLRVANIAGDEALIEATRSFGVAHPGCSVSIADAVDEADALADAENHVSDCDVYVLTLRSRLYRAFLESGFVADLSASPALSSAAADMTGQMASAIQSEGRLCAMPMAVGNYCQSLNVPALQALTGRSREEIPTDWPGFLALLEQLADSGALSRDGDYRLYDADMPAEGLREMLLGWMLQDCRLWAEADDSAAERLPQAILPALEAFDRIDWSRLTATDDWDGALGGSFSASSGLQFEQGNGAREALLSDGMLDIAVTPQMEGMELWPLSVCPGGARLIGQVATAVCVNPYSANPEASLAFVAYTWENTDIETRMSLCQSMNAPTLNAAYSEDLAYMAEDAAALQQSIDAAQNDGERASLQDALDQLQAYMEDYRQNGRWLTTQESISRYRAHADDLVPIGPDFGADDLQEDLMFQFLDGTITPNQFADRLSEALKEIPHNRVVQ